MDMSNRTCKVTTNLAPLDIQKCFVRLKKVSVISRFLWQDWMDAEMEFMPGHNDWSGGKMKYKRKIRRADSLDGMVVWCPLGTD